MRALILVAMVTVAPLSPEWIELTGHDLIGPPPPEAHHSPSEARPEPKPKTKDSVSRNMGNRGSDVERWRDLVGAHFAPGDVETALCLIAFESGGNPDAKNKKSGASGLMQVLPSWAPKFGASKADLFDPDVNLSIARKLRDDGGWKHWSPYKRGECR